ncbi:MAG: putative hydrolase of the superfamily [Thermoleophilaceae bacterium]|nr:putative hydrolase of the superfamily [Thermoleophilaceae bacterium]
MTELRAVLIDALGTLVELQPPAPRLRRILRESGFEVSEEQAAAGFAAEIAYYLDHHLDGSDPERLERLRDRCAEELRSALGIPELDHVTARRAMLGALEFTPYEDVLPALRELRQRGLALVMASNWDCSLPNWLEPTGILELVDGVVTSAEVGAPKPSTRVFERALAIAHAAPAEAVHVGDRLDNDVEGAAAAGIRPVLMQREGEPPPGVEAISSLLELPALL